MRLPILAWLIVVVSVTSASGQTPQGPNAEGEGLYTARCAKCHEVGCSARGKPGGIEPIVAGCDSRLPLPPGVMRSQGAELTQAQIEALARTMGNATRQCRIGN